MLVAYYVMGAESVAGTVLGLLAGSLRLVLLVVFSLLIICYGKEMTCGKPRVL